MHHPSSVVRRRSSVVSRLDSQKPQAPLALSSLVIHLNNFEHRTWNYKYERTDDTQRVKSAYNAGCPVSLTAKQHAPTQHAPVAPTGTSIPKSTTKCNTKGKARGATDAKNILNTPALLYPKSPQSHLNKQKIKLCVSVPLWFKN